MIFERADGSCPFLDEWKTSNAITTQDWAKIRAKLIAIEDHEGTMLPSGWWKKYHTSSEELRELVVKGPSRKQLRPLGIREGQEIVLFYGSVEKGNKLDSTDLAEADRLAAEYRNGKGKKRRFS